MDVKMFFAFGLAVGHCYFIQKCCDLHQQLNMNFDGCIDFDGSEGIERYESDQTVADADGVNFIKLGKKNRHHIWWLPPEVQFLSTNSSTGTAFQPVPVFKVENLRFLYNRKNPCPEFTRALLPFNDYVFLLDNGSLLVTGIADNVRPETMIFPPNAYCLDRVSLTDGVRRRRRSTHLLDHSYAIFVCPCLVYTCVRMCCHKRRYLNVEDGLEKCVYAPEIPAHWSLNYIDYDGNSVDLSKNFGIAEGIPTCDRYHYLNDNTSTRTKNFWILPDGSVRVENRSTDVAVADYCIHFLNVRGRYLPNLRACPENFGSGSAADANTEPSISYGHRHSCAKQMVDHQALLYKIYFVAGAAFLGLTLLVYVLIAKLRESLFNKILCAHVASLFVCYAAMAFDKIVRPSGTEWCCKLTGYIIQYSFIASTLWLNAMCLSIFNSFRGFNCVSSPAVDRLKRKNTCVIYSMYVWGGSTIVSLLTYTAEHTAILSSQFKPHFENRSCWFKNRTSQLLYFYFPVTVVLASNLLLFVLTMKKIIVLQNNSADLLNHESKKHVGNNEVASNPFSFALYARLFSLMGATWIFEVLSWAIGGPDYYWYVPDAINALRGVFVFIICCCKKEIFFLILNRPPETSTSCLTSTQNVRSRSSTLETKNNSIQMILIKNSVDENVEESA